MISLDLSTQTQDERVKTSVCDLFGMNPARRQKLLASERCSRCIEKRNEKIELRGSKVDLDAWNPCQAPEPRGKFEVVKPVTTPFRSSLGRAVVSHRCSQPGNAFTESEGLCKVVGCPRVQSTNFMVLINEVRACGYYWRTRQRGQAPDQRKRCFRMHFQHDGVCKLRSQQSQEFCFLLNQRRPERPLRQVFWKFPQRSDSVIQHNDILHRPKCYRCARRAVEFEAMGTSNGRSGLNSMCLRMSDSLHSEQHDRERWPPSKGARNDESDCTNA